MGTEQVLQSLSENRILFVDFRSKLVKKSATSLGESVGDGLRGRRDPPVTLRT